MKVHTDRRRSPAGRRMIVIGSMLALAALLAASVPGVATAKRYVGTAGKDRVAGTAKRDAINLKAGADFAKARGGADTVRGGKGADVLRGNAGRDKLLGGKGRDRLAGGPGRDRLAGGPGRDRLAGGPGRGVINAVDGARDKRINGGPGRDVCRIDPEDAEITRSCEVIRFGGGGSDGGGDGGDGDAGGGDGDGGDGGGGDGLALTSAAGFTCDSSDLECIFGATGTGADSLVGEATGGGGVTVDAGPSVTAQGDRWRANGGYSCISDGFIRITIAADSIDIPVDCV